MKYGMPKELEQQLAEVRKRYGVLEAVMDEGLSMIKDNKKRGIEKGIYNIVKCLSRL